MKNIYEVYQKLKKKYPEDSISFEEDARVLFYETEEYALQFNASRVDQNQEIQMHLLYGGRRYDHQLINSNEAYQIAKRFRDGRITIEEVYDKSVKLKGLLSYRNTHKGPVRKTIITTFAVILIILVLLLLSSAYYSISKRHGDLNATDVGSLIFCFFILYAAISLITYAFGREIYGWAHFFASIMTGFGIGLIFFLWPELVDGTPGKKDVIGSCIVALFIIVTGGGFFWTSHLKKNTSVKIIRRTANMPTKEQLKKVYEKLYEKRMLPAVFIKPSEQQALFAGSRAGGKPYADGTKEIPHTKNGYPTVFLMQINFSEIGAATELPDHGILQFFMGDQDGNVGFEMKTLFYPEINEMLSEDPGKTWPIELVPGEMPDVWNTVYDSDLGELYAAAEAAGVSLDGDLDKADFIDNELFKLSDLDYLLGSIRLAPPWTWAAGKGDYRLDVPLLSVGPDSPIITWLYYFMEFEEFQVFTSKDSLESREFNSFAVENYYNGNALER